MDIFKYTSRRSGPDAEEIIKYIQANYRTISLSQVAEKFHYNSTYISRFLYAHYQKTFMELLTEIRLQHAMNYLNKTNKDIAEIAQLAGYTSSEHFSRTFKKNLGLSPSEYRRRTKIKASEVKNRHL